MAKCIVHGLPVVRPRCCNCDKALTYWAETLKTEKRPTKEKDRWTGETLYKRVVVEKRFEFWRGYGGFRKAGRPPLFCTLTCALQFAVACHKAGYRFQSAGGRNMGDPL